MSELLLDMLGSVCPLPVIELGKRIDSVDVGSTIAVLSDDPAAATDIPAWCRMRGHEYVGERPEAVGIAYVVRRTH